MSDVKDELEDESEALHTAISSGDLKIVHGILTNEACPNTHNRFNETPLHTACKMSDCKIDPTKRLEIVKLLWEKGAKMNVKGGKRKETPLHYAVKSELVEVIEFLLKHGANGNSRDKDEKTALHAAATLNNSSNIYKIIDLLRNNGANLHAQDSRWRTPLIEAVCRSNSNAVKALLKAGAQIDHTNRMGLTALLYACETQKIGMVKLLLENGANVHVREQRKLSCVLHFVGGSGRPYMFKDDTENKSDVIAKLVIQAGARVNAVDREGSTALHVAVDTKDAKLVDTLIKAGADVGINDEYGNTPLHVLLSADRTMLADTRTEVFEKLVKLLVDKGANVNELNNNLETPFHYALWHGNLNIVSYLLQNKADTKALWYSNKGSFSFLHESPACNTPHLCGENPEEGFTSLCVAATLGHVKVVNLLLDGNEVNVDASNHTVDHDVVKSPLYFAVKNGHYDVVKTLLDAGSKVNRFILHDTTALHVAVSKGHQELIYLLLENGADANIKDTYGRTPLSCAVEYRRESLEPIALILLMYRIRDEFCKKRVNEEDSLVVNSWKSLIENERLYKAEFLSLQDAILCDNYTLDEVLKRDVDSLTKFLENDGVFDALTLKLSEGISSMYYEMLKIRFSLASERSDLLNSAITSLNVIFESPMKNTRYDTLPVDVVRKIISYCSFRDLKKIVSIVN